MMEKKSLKILVVGFLLIIMTAIITGCSESSPTGEMVYEKPVAETFCQRHSLGLENLFLDS